MDKGEFIKGGYMVRPGDGGSWIVYSEVEFGQGGERRYVTPTRGFTHHRDLLDWLAVEHGVLAGSLAADYYSVGVVEIDGILTATRYIKKGGMAEGPGCCILLAEEDFEPGTRLEATASTWRRLVNPTTEATK